MSSCTRWGGGWGVIEEEANWGTMEIETIHR